MSLIDKKLVIHRDFLQSLSDTLTQTPIVTGVYVLNKLLVMADKVFVEFRKTPKYEEFFLIFNNN